VLHLATITAPFFPALAALGEFEAVEADEMPAEYRTLLAHEHHMTVTVEQFHGDEVDVRVLADDREGEVYSRTSLLVCRGSGRVVQLGVMRINLHGLSREVREEIESRRVPLGRTLIRHNVLRRVELQRLWRIWPGAELVKHLGPAVGESPDSNILGAATELPAVRSGRPPYTAGQASSGTQLHSNGAIHLNHSARVFATANPGSERLAYDTIYGRSAGIIVEGRPAVELLEIVTV
jgi:chorismate-pyruvate lyase